MNMMNVLTLTMPLFIEDIRYDIRFVKKYFMTKSNVCILGWFA